MVTLVFVASSGGHRCAMSNVPRTQLCRENACEKIDQEKIFSARTSQYFARDIGSLIVKELTLTV